MFMEFGCVKTDFPERYTERFAYIETELFWGDGVTAGQIASTFGLSRQIAQKVIDRYRKEHPGQIYYNAGQRRHIPTESFEPHYIRTSPIAFLDYLRGQALVGLYHEDQDWSDLAVVDVDRLLHPELPVPPIRTLLAALRRQEAVTIDYRKKDLKPGSVTTRVVSPHHLIFADGRYHIRAYCHQKERQRRGDRNVDNPIAVACPSIAKNSLSPVRIKNLRREGRQ